MARQFSAKVVTASDLLIGDVIYLRDDDQWSRHLSEAEIITDEAHAQLRLLDGERQSARVVGVYLAEISCGLNGAAATHFREEFRAAGPSNYAHGKQQDVSNV